VTLGIFAPCMVLVENINRAVLFSNTGPYPSDRVAQHLSASENQVANCAAESIFSYAQLTANSYDFVRVRPMVFNPQLQHHWFKTRHPSWVHVSTDFIDGLSFTSKINFLRPIFLSLSNKQPGEFYGNNRTWPHSLNFRPSG
jgi:hypothetical protein